MDVCTSHLVSAEKFEEMPEEDSLSYERVPKGLTLSAQLELMGKDETYVGKEATSEIATWARSKRKSIIAKVKKRKANKYCCK